MTNAIQNFREERLDILSGTRGGPGAKAVRFSDVSDVVLRELSLQVGAKSAVLTVDVPLSSAGWADGPAITIGPGLWQVQAQVQITASAAIAATKVCARISDATVEFCTAMHRIGPDAGDSALLSMTCLIATKIKRTIGVQVKPELPDADLLMASTCAPLSGGTETATRILAVKLVGI